MPVGWRAAALAFPSPPLADANVRLRPWRETDAPAIERAFGDPVIERFSWPWVTPYTEADARNWLAEQEEHRLRGEELDFAVVEPADAEAVLGGAALYDLDLEQGCAAVGFWLVPEARGRGAATSAVRLLARWALDELRLARFELTCSPDNQASQRVAERCGFTREGVLRSHIPFKGGRRDTVLFSLLPTELVRS